MKNLFINILSLCFYSLASLALDGSDVEKMFTISPVKDSPSDKIDITFAPGSDYRALKIWQQVLNEAERINPVAHIIDFYQAGSPEYIDHDEELKTTFTPNNATDFKRFYINLTPTAGGNTEGFKCNIWRSKALRLFATVWKHSCTKHKSAY